MSRRTESTLSANASVRSVARNVAVNYGAFVTQTVLGLVVTPILLRGLGVDRFGVLSIVLILAGYLAIAELGVGTATVRKVAAVRAKGAEAQLDEIATTSVGLFVILAAGGLVALAVLTAALGHVIHQHGSDLTAARWALIFIGAAQLIALLFNVYPALLFGSGRSDLLTSTGIVIAIGGAAGQILAAALFHSLVAVAAISAGATLLTALAVRYIARKHIAGVRLSRINFRRQLARELVGTGWRNAAIGVSAAIAVSSDVIVVGAMLSVKSAAAYGVAARGAGLVRALSTRVSDVLVPTYAHHNALGDRERIYGLLRESTTASLLIALPAAIPLICFSRSLLYLWLGTVPTGSAAVLRLLILTVLISMPGANVFSLLSGMNRLGFLVRGTTLLAVVNLVISIYLTSRFGIIGPALGTLVILLGFEFAVLPAYACRLLGLASTQLLRDCAWLSIPIAVATLFAVGFAQSAPSAPVAAVLAASSAAVFIITAALSAGRDRRTRYLGLLRSP
jgi:O-antigen/teichoic acid export membrane protein